MGSLILHTRLSKSGIKREKILIKIPPIVLPLDIQFQFCLYHESLVVVTEYESISLAVISKNLEKCISISGICLKITAVFSCLLRLKGMVFSNKCWQNLQTPVSVNYALHKSFCKNQNNLDLYLTCVSTLYLFNDNFTCVLIAPSGITYIAHNWKNIFHLTISFPLVLSSICMALNVQLFLLLFSAVISGLILS